jgi:membrane-associated phospholipid phosphatase
VAGIIAVGWSILLALVIAAHPGPNVLDRSGFSFIPKSAGSPLLVRITELGDPPVLIIGAVAAALMVVRRDPRRAAACLIGPLAGAIMVEYLFKPLVGRHFEGVLSYPSGNVTDVAAVATAWIVAVPARARPAVVAAGAVVTALMSVAVIGLRWHYPSDAFAGALLGIGTLLLVDGVLHLRPNYLWRTARLRRAGPPAAEQPRRSESA